MLETLRELVTQYGYALIVFLVFVESVGVPLPGDTALVTAAALAARGTLSLTGVIAAAIVGAISGGTAGYWIGLRTGTSFVLRHGRIFRVDQSRLDRAQRFFERYGAATIFFGRFVAILRMLAVILAGVARMPFGRFFLYNALSSVVWSVTLGALGYTFGRNLPRLIDDIGRASLILALFIALAVSVIWGWRWFYRNGGALVAGLSGTWGRMAVSPRLRAMKEKHPTLWSFIVARFARGEYLAVHLLGGLLVSLGVLAIFGAITEDVVEGAPLTLFDVEVARRLHASVSSAALSALHVVSYLGSPIAMAVILVVVSISLIFRRRWIGLAAWVAAFAGAALLDAVLKLIVHRSRLPFAAEFLHGQTISFPSGHALGALVGYGMLAYLIASALRRPALRAAVVAIFSALVVAIGVGRLYLGVHYFSDLTAGFAAGLLWLTTCITGLELSRRYRGPMVGGERSLAA
jgi:membrane protein DedA with SNARE-associated domain/membrane-associated phospholipid phosphatase